MFYSISSPEISLHSTQKSVLQIHYFQFVDTMTNNYLESILDHDTKDDLRQALHSCDKELCFPSSMNPETTCTFSTSLDHELARLENLRSYRILDADRDVTFERISALASRIFNVPISLVCLVDLGRQWFLSNRGLGDTRETPRKFAFCAHAICSHLDILVVPDATKDERFRNNPLVTGEPHIRFYAGAPLLSPEGFKLGTLCIIDSKPRPEGMTLSEKQNLRDMTDMVIDALVSRRSEQEKMMRDRGRIIASTAHDLLTPLTCMQLNLNLLSEDDSLNLDKHQRDSLSTAIQCTEWMTKICGDSIDKFRGTKVKREKAGLRPSESNGGKTTHPDDDGMNRPTSPPTNDCTRGNISVPQLIDSIKTVIEAHPKEVPLTFEVSEDVPSNIISSDISIFRSALNLLTNSCKVTKVGSIRFRVYVKALRDSASNLNKGSTAKKDDKVAPIVTKDMLIFECIDTGEGVDIEQYVDLYTPRLDGSTRKNEVSPGLGLYSVSKQITSIGGQFGFRPRDSNENSDKSILISREITKNASETRLEKMSSHGSARNKVTSGSRCSLSIPPDNLSIESSNNSTSGSIFWFSVPLVLPPQSPTSLNQSTSTIVEKKTENFKDAEICSNTSERPTNKKTVANEASLMPPPGPSHVQKHLESRCSDLDTKCPNNEAKEEQNGTQNDKKREAPCDVVDMSVSTDSSSNERKKYVLIIDDSLVIRKTLERALTKLGFEVKQAENGMQGLEKMKEKIFDFVFCDFLMPVMDGLDCVQQYRQWETKNRSGIRQYIVGISAHASPCDAERGLSVGMNKYIPKPVPLSTLRMLSASDEVTAMSKSLDKDCQTSYPKAKRRRFHPDISDDDCSSIVSSADLATRPVCLIAEDSVIISKALIRHIETRGWRACAVTSGEDALRLMKIRKWDAIILDDELPLLTGTRCIVQFRKWEAENRVTRQENVIFASANYDPERTILPDGFDLGLGKPFNLEQLYKFLSKAQNGQGNEMFKG